MKTFAYGADEIIEFTLRLNGAYFEDIFHHMEQVSEFFIQSRKTLVGFLECRKSRNDVKPMNSVTGLKRSVATPKSPSKTKSSKADSSPQNVPAGRKDIHSALKDLDLLPQMGSDLGCSMCPYVATKKSHLKRHYKLKHLGGADLAVNCSICSKKCSTKSNLVAHIVAVHKLTRQDALKLVN